MSSSNCTVDDTQARLLGRARDLMAQNPPDPSAIHAFGQEAWQSGSAELALELFSRAADIDPGNAAHFVSIGRLLAKEAMFNQSTLAFLRAQELAPHDPAILVELADVLTRSGRPAEARTALEHAKRLTCPACDAVPTPVTVGNPASQNGAARPAPSQPEPGQFAMVSRGTLLLDGLSFSSLALYGDALGSSLVGASSDGKYFLKLEIRHNPYKKHDLAGEREIMLALNRKHCVTCPRAVGFGSVTRSTLQQALDERGQALLAASPADSYAYLIQEFVPNTGKATLGDLLLAVLEQKALGIFHADLRPENCRMDDATGVCYLIDYDQAEPLDEATRTLDNPAFFDWCDALVRRKYARWKFQHFLQYFPTLDRQRAVASLLRNGAFNLASTRLFTNQITTAMKAGIYHTIREASVFIDGERSLESRRSCLETITFRQGETVLDVGCGSGIVATYLARRGCRVTGIDLDPEIIRGCRILSHILGDDITYFHHDLDQGAVPGEFDTVLLFSVLHHTKQLEANARNIAGQAQRIIIECRLHEGGLKPSADGHWVPTSRWDYPSIEALTAGLENLFPGFRLHRNHGQGDRDRYVLELVKTP